MDDHDVGKCLYIPRCIVEQYQEEEHVHSVLMSNWDDNHEAVQVPLLHMTELLQPEDRLLVHNQVAAAMALCRKTPVH